MFADVSENFVFYLAVVMPVPSTTSANPALFGEWCAGEVSYQEVSSFLDLHS
jgi:hypothetical protein